MQSDFTAAQRVVFGVKSRLLIANRGLRNIASASKRRPARMAEVPSGAVALAEDRSALYSECTPQERAMQLGKVENLRVAARLLNGVVIEENAEFSFWREIGRPSTAKGFVIGRELRRGCLIPAIAGGICQLTNALCRVAKDAGMELVERHRHSAAVDGLVLDADSDATVFWNYVDFRFRAKVPIRLAVHLNSTELTVRLDRLP